MKLNEITAHNKVNLQRCSTKQIQFIQSSIHYLDCDDSNRDLFLSHCRFDKYVRNKNGKGYTLKQGKRCKYVCSVLCWDKDTDECRCIHQFGFNNRNRLRNRIAALQKNNKDIACRIISLNEE